MNRRVFMQALGAIGAGVASIFVGSRLPPIPAPKVANMDTIRKAQDTVRFSGDPETYTFGAGRLYVFDERTQAERFIGRCGPLKMTVQRRAL